MKKAEYIEKYGLEAYERKCEKDRQWRAKHKEYCQAYGKEYREKNKAQLTVYLKRWHEENKEIVSEKHKAYYQEHGEDIKIRAKKYYQNNKEKVLAYQKAIYDTDPSIKKNYSKEYRKKNNYNQKYRNTKTGRAANLLSAYKTADKKAGREQCSLTRNWIIEKIFSSSCVYCGDYDWLHLGCDRIDNTQPHTPENCICACGICNIEREIQKMSVAEFRKYRETHPRAV